MRLGADGSLERVAEVVLPDTTAYEVFGKEDPSVTWLDGVPWLSYVGVSDWGVTPVLARGRWSNGAWSYERVAEAQGHTDNRDVKILPVRPGGKLWRHDRVNTLPWGPKRMTWATSPDGGVSWSASRLLFEGEAAWEAAGNKDYHWSGSRQEEAQDIGFLARAAEFGRGIGPEGHHPVRRTLDDGRARQARDAAELARDLLLVAGRLYHRAPVPGWHIQLTTLATTDRETRLAVNRMRVEARPWRPFARPQQRDAMMAPGLPAWLTFGPEAGHEAGAVAESLADALAGTLRCPMSGEFPVAGRPGVRQPHGSERLTVVDRDALLAAMPRQDPESWVARMGAAFLAGAARAVGDMPLEGVEAYLAARRAVEDVAAAGGHEAAFARVRAFADLVRERVRPDGMHVPGPLLAALAVTVRYDLFERHRAWDVPGADEADERALGALARP